MNQIALSFLAVIPALLLCWYVYEKDRIEKEPLGLLILLFLAGAAAFLPSIALEKTLVGAFDEAFRSQTEVSLTGVRTFLTTGAKLGHSLSCALLGVALVEEGLKFAVLVLITYKNKNFGHLFDGVVYALFVSLGFAAAENLRFALMDGWDTLLLRFVSSLPAHMIFGVISGICYTLWHGYRLARLKEKILESEGVLTVEKPLVTYPRLILTFLLPFAVHGFYAFGEFFGGALLRYLFYALLLIPFVLSFVVLHRLSKADSVDDEIAFRFLIKRYPHLKGKEDTTLDDLEAMEKEEENA